MYFTPAGLPPPQQNDSVQSASGGLGDVDDYADDLGRCDLHPFKRLPVVIAGTELAIQSSTLWKVLFWPTVIITWSLHEDSYRR